MQTFLPYSDFVQSVKSLDYRRLGKQRVEAFQILKIIKEGKTTGGWVNHPAVKMWKHNSDALAFYMNCCIDEWISRGYKNTMKKEEVPSIDLIKFPNWLGQEQFHASHRSNLLRKDFSFYSKYNWKEPSNLEYIWPNE